MFRFHRFKSTSIPLVPIPVLKVVTQVDDDGISHTSEILIPSDDAVIPSPSEYTLEFALQSGSLAPVNLDEYVNDASSFESFDALSSLSSKLSKSE